MLVSFAGSLTCSFHKNTCALACIQTGTPTKNFRQEMDCRRPVSALGCIYVGFSTIGPVAQWIRHRPTEPGIAGSSPAGVICVGMCLVFRDNEFNLNGQMGLCTKWTHWGLNPGPSACEADVIPLHHVPNDNWL